VTIEGVERGQPVADRPLEPESRARPLGGVSQNRKDAFYCGPVPQASPEGARLTDPQEKCDGFVLRHATLEQFRCESGRKTIVKFMKMLVFLGWSTSAAADAAPVGYVTHFG
jgi:hypothetical protein